METIITRYQTQNTKGLRGIKKIISEQITMFKWKLKSLKYV